MQTNPAASYFHCHCCYQHQWLSQDSLWQEMGIWFLETIWLFVILFVFSDWDRKPCHRYKIRHSSKTTFDLRCLVSVFTCLVCSFFIFELFTFLLLSKFVKYLGFLFLKKSYHNFSVEMFYLNSTLNFGISPVLVFLLEVYYKVDRLLNGLTAQWYSNKTSLSYFLYPWR